MDYVNCELCPRRCGANRKAGEKGWCRCPDIALVAKSMIHKWDEPALAGYSSAAARWDASTARIRISATIPAVP